MVIGLVVPVLNNFKGFTELMHSVNDIIYPVIINNWEHNNGVSKAWNDGFIMAAEAGCSHIMIANDDILFEGVEPLRKLADAMDSHSIDLLTPTNTREGHKPDGEVSFGENPDFAAFMVRPDFMELYGRFDENFFPAYFEDNDMAYRIKLGGGRYANHLGVGFLHRGSVTQNSQEGGVVPGHVFEKNRSYYYSKWGGLPMQEQYTTPFGLDSMTFKDW